MAEIKRRPRAGDVPQPTQVHNNLDAAIGAQKDLNFKVEPDFHHRFKVRAALGRMSMLELLRRAFDADIEKYGE